MRRWFILGLVVAMAAIVAAIPWGDRFTAHVGVAQAAQTFEVVVGTDVEADLVETNAFLPQAITVGVGDTVSWRFGGFHTVTFTAGGPPPDFIIPGPGAGELQIGAGGFPIPAGPNPPSGNYDGRTLVSTGTPQDDPADTPPFTLNFTQPGVYPYICLVHFGMAGSVTVLAAGSTPPETPGQVRARGQAEFGAIQALLAGVTQGVQSASAGSRGGVSVRTIDAGLNTPLGASKIAFLPDTLTVRRGDVLAWVNADTFNIHTVTFASGGPAPDFIAPRGDPSAGGPPQLVIAANAAGPVGGTTYAGSGYINSGILFPGQSFSLTIDAPAGTYTYFCLIHGAESGGMKGTITVTE